MSDESKTADEPVVPERQWPVTVTLKYPVQFGKDMTIESLTFRRGKLADIKGLRIDAIPPTEQIMMVASRMCGQPLKVIESLDADDASDVIELVLSFFVRCLPTMTGAAP